MMVMVNGSAVSMSFEDVTMANNSQFGVMLEGETTTPGTITFERLTMDGCTGAPLLPSYLCPEGSETVAAQGRR